MGTGAEIAAYAAIAATVVGTGVSVYSQQKTAEAQQESANEQAKISIDQAAAEADARKAQAEKIRKMGRMQKGEAKTALAASGVKLGEGSAVEVDKAIAQGSEEDALSALLTGDRIVKSADREAQSLVKAGNNARSNANLASAGTVLSSAGSVASGWKTSAKK